MPRILYVGRFEFAGADPAAIRVLAVGKALRDAGYDVEYASYTLVLNPQERAADGRYYYQGMPYANPCGESAPQPSRAKRILRYLAAGRIIVRWLARQDLSDVAAIIAYHGSSLLFLPLLHFSRRHGIPLVADCTEWFQPSHNLGGALGPLCWDSEYLMRVVYPRVGSMIAISSYLQRYYAQRNCRTIRIPLLVDLAEDRWKVSAQKFGHGLHLVYAGTPGKKDLLGIALRGLRLLRSAGVDVTLHLLGCSREQVVSICLQGDHAALRAVEDRVVFYGRVPQTEVPSYLARADFSILLREEARYAQAGFPTKLVESLAVGLPVILNPTSDIAEYVHDGVEGIVLPEASIAAFVAGVQRAAALTPDERTKMADAARHRAQASFDYRNYITLLADFIAQQRG